MSPAQETPLVARLGALLQRQRLRQTLTQSELAEKAELSLKYLGEIERGEANVTALALDRIARALGWDPWTLFSTEQQPLSQRVQRLLLLELCAARDRIQKVIDWVAALDPADREPLVCQEDARVAAPIASRPRRRGRPRGRGRQR